MAQRNGLKPPAANLLQLSYQHVKVKFCVFWALLLFSMYTRWSWRRGKPPVAVRSFLTIICELPHQGHITEVIRTEKRSNFLRRQCTALGAFMTKTWSTLVGIRLALRQNSIFRHRKRNTERRHETANIYSQLCALRYSADSLL